MEEEEKEEYKNEEQVYSKAFEQEMYPVTNQEQLGQDILRTFARISDPDRVEFRKVKRKFPIVKQRTMVDEKGKEKTIEVFEGWDEKEWEIPIRLQPKYHELITDDISRSFLSADDFKIYVDNVALCLMIRSFAKRYGYDLSIHHNNIVDEINAMVAASGGVQGQRVKIAKSNISETVYRANIEQMMGKKDKKRNKLFGIDMPF